jgi:hypothetical protein
MATVLARCTLRDVLDHAWRDERVTFPLPAGAAGPLAIADEQGRRQPCQVTTVAGEARVAFVVDELPALGERSYTLVAAPPPRHRSPRVRRAGRSLVLSNGELSLRLPTGLAKDGSAPAPLLGVKRGQGPWLGAGRLALSPHLTVASLTATEEEAGPLWCQWRLTYACTGGQLYHCRVRLYASGGYAEIREESHLARAGHWEFSLRPGLRPDQFWTHRHDLRPLGDAVRNLGSIQMPVYSGIWVPDDYYYVALSNAGDPRRDCVALLGINGGEWDYPHENQIDLERGPGGDTFFRFSLKAGHRAWLLAVADRDAVTTTEPRAQGPLPLLQKRYETPLDKVKDYVLEWDDVPPAERPFALADRAQLDHARQLAQSYPKLREYVARCNPALPGDYTYYHAGTHRTFEPDRWNDPAVLFVTAGDPAQRRQQALHLKQVVLEGLAHRRKAMLDGLGHVDHDCASINLGRGLRPWVALYDFAASESVFTPAEDRLARATFAFFCYKIADPDFWPADALVLRDDHPRSAHRTHWFPQRHHDWAFYNIDNIPHNFHGDLWAALGCMALTLPRHPQSRAWVTRTLGWWESELTEWVFPEGAWLESSTYTLNSMKDYLIYCRMLANARWRDYFTDERLQRAFRFVAEALGPHDERIGGRSLPVMGDGSYPNGFCYVLGWMAGLCRERAPEFARLMSHAWHATGQYLTEPGRFGLNFCDFLFLDPAIPPATVAPLPSRHYRGMGAILRHRQGTPQETWCFIKAGIIYSHFHEPEGTFQLWWNSAPLCDEYGIQYGMGVNGVPSWEPSCHNCIEIPGLPTAYNKGDITTFVAGEAFDYVVVDAPILPAYLEKGQGIWGFRGEMGPAGWHRRQFLLVKDHFLALYDDLESPYPSVYHLNVKADAVQLTGAGRVDFTGRLGTDLAFLLLDLGDRQVQFAEYDVKPGNQYGFQPPPRFNHQHQLRVAGRPGQHYASLLLPHRPAEPVTLAQAPGGGAVTTSPAAAWRVVLEGRWRTLAEPDFVLRGQAAAVGRLPDGTLLLHLAAGDRLGDPRRLVIHGDGPYTATLGPTGELTLDSQGIGRWLTLAGPRFATATCDEQAHRLEPLADGTTRLYLPPGHHRLRCR